jgi:hypothetical protein
MPTFLFVALMSWGYLPSSGLGIALVVLTILMLAGRL